MARASNWDFADRNPPATQADRAAGESGTERGSPAAHNRALILAAKEAAVVLADIIRAANGNPAHSPTILRLHKAIRDAENEPARF